MHDLQDSGDKPTDLIREGVCHDMSVDDLDLMDNEYPSPEGRRSRRYLPPIPLRKTERVQHQTQPDPESKLVRRAKLGALVIVVALLAASLIIAAHLAHFDESTDTASSERSQPTGAVALSGLAFLDNPHDHHAPLARASREETGIPQGIRSTNETPAADPASSSDTALEADFRDESGTDVRKGAAPTNTEGSNASEKHATVREFYELVATSPRKALTLLDPTSFKSHEILLQSWRPLDSVTVHDLHEETNGNIRTVVTMSYPRGEQIRLTQVLELSQTAETLISEATLLSADLL